MENLTDKKPVEYNSGILRRTDEHVLSRSVISVTSSGDKAHKAAMTNTVVVTTPDSDPRWGVYPTQDAEQPV